MINVPLLPIIRFTSLTRLYNFGFDLLNELIYTVHEGEGIFEESEKLGQTFLHPWSIVSTNVAMPDWFPGNAFDSEFIHLYRWSSTFEQVLDQHLRCFILELIRSNPITYRR